MRSAISLTLRIAICFGAALCLSLPSLSAAESELLFSEPSGPIYATDDGTVALAWRSALPNPDAAREFEVRRWAEGESGPGTLVYEGPDTATFLSGLDEGTYELRIRARKPGEPFPEWGSVALSVEVEYIDSWLVATLMSVGAVTFATILGTIALGHRATRLENIRS